MLRRLKASTIIDETLQFLVMEYLHFPRIAHYTSHKIILRPGRAGTLQK